MEEWFSSMGAYHMAFPDAPALAADMALYGPPADFGGYQLAASAIGTPTEIEIYPNEMGPYEGLG